MLKTSLVIFWFLLAQIVIRYLLPMGATNDFRYMFPIIPSLACLAVNGLTLFEARGRIKWARYGSMAMMYLFIGSSLLYYLVTVKR
ncbi:MAG: hypothetical protein JST80_02385 [Bdellovibrionales bacterium]|nr:hypothetical protein [Bdellovibrionales bacterium]